MAAKFSWTAVVVMLALIGGVTYLGARHVLPSDAVTAIMTAVASAILGFHVGNGVASRG